MIFLPLNKVKCAWFLLLGRLIDSKIDLTFSLNRARSLISCDATILYLNEYDILETATSSGFFLYHPSNALHWSTSTSHFLGSNLCQALISLIASLKSKSLSLVPTLSILNS